MLLLLHGLGGTSSLWDGFTDQPHVAPDLPGHGTAAPLEAYDFRGLAEGVAAQLDGAVTYAVLGHSLGGVVGLVLAGGLLRVRRVVGLGIKVAGRAGAAGRPAALDGVRGTGGGWRLALDLRAFGVGRPDVAGMLAVTDAEVLLARGEHDPMVSDADLAALGAPRVTLPGLGHSAHVEDPAAVRALVSP